MPSDKPAKPELDVWDSCCLIGVLNKEQDKLPALLSQTQYFESGKAILGIPTTVVTEVVTLSDGTPAEPKLKEFLDNHYVELLQPTLEVSLMSSKLQFRFDSKRMPDMRATALAAGVPRDQASRLKSRDSEILATALVYKAQRLTTYDPFLIFLGKEYITQETGLIIGPPDSSWLNFDQEPE
jgi:hypothetical protein